jgi:hypothetical protein
MYVVGWFTHPHPLTIHSLCRFPFRRLTKTFVLFVLIVIVLGENVQNLL